MDETTMNNDAVRSLCDAAMFAGIQYARKRASKSAEASARDYIARHFANPRSEQDRVFFTFRFLTNFHALEHFPD
jgi:hypothetical protein